MTKEVFHSFLEAGREILLPETVIARAWPDIRIALETQPAGFKKSTQQEEMERAFERAVEMLGMKFENPDALIQLLQQQSITLPAGIDRKRIMHFAGRWKTHLQKAATIEQCRSANAAHADSILALHGKGFIAELTPEEQQERRFRKAQAKAQRPVIQ